mmetsp:Transcript_66597/g.206165  ORF Transcript_66597/g.206165 Transcript_66597/m.206165 type:complete len:248 (-) Transcript_66597:57-800(-)
MGAAAPAPRRAGRRPLPPGLLGALAFLAALAASRPVGGGRGSGASFAGPPARGGRLSASAAATRSRGVALGVRKELADFQVGEEVSGVVKAWLGQNGYIIDIGCKLNAHLEACEMCDGFPTTLLEKEQEITARVLDVSEAEKRLRLTLRTGSIERPKRLGLLREYTEEDVERFAEAQGKEWFEGVVHSFAFYGVFIRCKQPDGSGYVDGVLHRKNFDEDFGKGLQRGDSVRVRLDSRQGRKLFLLNS